MSVIAPFRRASQLFGLLLANLNVAAIFSRQISQGILKSVCLPFLYCHSCPMAAFACPIGVMQYYAAIHSFPFLLVGEFFIVGLIGGRLICGWVCPVGLFQELLYKIKSKKIALPRGFTIIPWAVFALFVVILPFLTTEHWFSKLCPVGTITAGIPWVLWNPINPATGSPTIEAGRVGLLFAIKLIILCIALVLFVISKRPFCRYVCPIGLFWSLFNKVSILKLEVDKGCTECDACRKKCPEDAKIYNNPNPQECIRCFECTDCKHIKVVSSIGMGSNKVALKTQTGKVSEQETA